MPDIEIFCPATQKDTTLTLTRQRQPTACQQQTTCPKRTYVKCCLRALKITGGKSI